MILHEKKNRATGSTATPASGTAPGNLLQAVRENPTRETDLYAWLLHQANMLRSRQPDFIDWSELAEELDEVVALARNEVVSRVTTVLAHLLKWKYQTQRRDESSWRNSIVRERVEVARLLESKNLQNYLDDQGGYARAYRDARKVAGAEMQLERHEWERLFPGVCEWDSKQALDDDFFPSLVSESSDNSR